MAALDRPTVKDASVDQVSARPDVDDFRVLCPVLGRDCHPLAWVGAREAEPAALQAQQRRDAHQPPGVHRRADSPAVAPGVVAEKVVDRELERPAAERHRQVQASKDVEVHPVVESASRLVGLQVRASLPRELQLPQQELAVELVLALWEQQAPVSQL